MRLIDADFLRERFGMDMDSDCSNCRKDEYHCGYDYSVCLMDFCCAIDDAPTIEVEPSREEAKKVEYNHHCPNCGRGLPAKRLTHEWCSCCFNWKYCPECGQKLRWE